MKRYSSIFYMLTVACGVASAQTAIIVQQYTFAPAGIASGQSMRLNLANIAGSASVCMGNLSFVNSDGTTIKNQAVTVNGGQTVSFSIQTTDIAGSPSTGVVRGLVAVDMQAGGVVITPPVPITPIVPGCSAVMSLEIVDNGTGQTRVILTNPKLVSGIVGPVVGPVVPLN